MKLKLKERGISQCLRKVFFVMRITLFFILVSSVFVFSANSYSQNAKFSLRLSNVSVSDVLKVIEEQSEFIFFYQDQQIDLNRNVDIIVVDKSVNEILDQLFKGSDNIYKINDRQIILGKSQKQLEIKSLPIERLFEELQQPQKKTLKGKVTDANGEPIPGTSVIVKGATVGTITNGEGVFVLDVPLDAKTLSFSFVGMKTQEIPVGNKTNFTIIMEGEIVGLEEVVAVGYGIQKKISLTAAVSSIKTEELRQSSSASLANALSGRITGLTSLQSGGGQPGRDDATMFLRGAATTNGTSPLILIDGVPRDNIRTIDPNEVSSVSILKDASATALFGVRGANGVILITTKRGVEGKMELKMSAEQSYTSFTREPERLHSLEYMALRNEAAFNDGITTPPFDQKTIDRYADPLAGLDPNDPDYEEKARVRRYMYPDHDYYREYISRYSPQTRINMSASGGTDKVSYFVNAAFLHQGGNLNTEPKSVLGYDPAAKMDRYNFRANIDYKVTKSLKSFLNIGSYIEQVNMPAAWLYREDTDHMMRDIIYQAQTILPITPGPTTIAGFGVAPGQIVDPNYMDRSAFEIMNRFGFRNEIRSNLNASFGLDWDLGSLVTKGLSIKGMISYDSKSTTAMQGAKSERLYLAEVNPDTNELSFAVKRSDESLLSINKGVDSRYSINMQGSLNYKRTFGNKHDVSGMILAQRDYWESNIGEIPFNLLGVSARFTYSYDERYLAEVNMGYNGSEQFAPSKRFGFFPAVSAGWILSNEDFLKGNKILTNLKLRASYGKVGNDKMGSARFLYLDNIAMGGGPLGSLGLGKGVSQGLLGNPGLTWEVAKKQNYGVDVQLLNELGLSVDYFVEDRSKILISRGTVPEFQGVPLGDVPKANMGIVYNSGYEVELTYNKSLTKDLFLTVKGNYSYNHNTRKFMDEPIRDESYVYRYRSTGYPIGQQWGYKIDYSNGNGFFNSQEELDSYLATTKYGFGDPRVGYFKYIDLNKDGVIDSKDESPIGYSNIPGVAYGLTFKLSYKSIDLTVFFQGVGKYSSNYAGQGVYEYIIRGTYFDYHKNAWTAERYANGDKISYPALSTYSTTNHVANDFFIMNRSFTRLKNIELGYTLPHGALKIIGIQKLRIYASGQNLFTWDHLRMGHLDPENNNSIGYPVTQMKNVGLDITF